MYLGRLNNAARVSPTRGCPPDQGMRLVMLLIFTLKLILYCIVLANMDCLPRVALHP